MIGHLLQVKGQCVKFHQTGQLVLREPESE